MDTDSSVGIAPTGSTATPRANVNARDLRTGIEAFDSWNQNASVPCVLGGDKYCRLSCDSVTSSECRIWWPRRGNHRISIPATFRPCGCRDLGATEIGNTDDEIDLRELWRALQRRKKLVAVTAGGVILLAALFTTYQRIFRPVYEGAFSLLITDPISNEGGGRSGMANVEGTMFEQLARNTTSNDIPTLIEVLQSPVLLQPVADQFDLETGALIRKYCHQHRWCQTQRSRWVF